MPQSLLVGLDVIRFVVNVPPAIVRTERPIRVSPVTATLELTIVLGKVVEKYDGAFVLDPWTMKVVALSEPPCRLYQRLLLLPKLTVPDVIVPSIVIVPVVVDDVPPVTNVAFLDVPLTQVEPAPLQLADVVFHVPSPLLAETFQL